MQSGHQEMVIVKRLSAQALAAEVFCAVLGRARELPIPEPLLVKDQSSGTFMFGSVFAEYPNLLQAFNIVPDSISAADERVIAGHVRRWTKLAPAVAFDEWIKNLDRHLRNLLWDGFDRFLLIDHEHSLGLHHRQRRDENWLLKLALAGVTAGDEVVERMKSRVLGAALEFDRECADEAARLLQGSPYPAASTNARPFFQFIVQRIPNLAARLASRFPSNQLTLEV